MARVLNSVTLTAPASPVSGAVGNTFTFTATPGFSGTSTVQRYDLKFEVSPSGGAYVTIAAGSSGLTTSGTNPIVNTNSTAAQSITVTLAGSGIHTIRISGAPTSGGSYTITSGTQTVNVAQAIVSAGIATGAALGSHAVTATTVAAGIAGAEAIGSHAVKATTVAAGIASGEALGAPSVAIGEAAAEVVAAGIASAEAEGEPTIEATVAAAGIVSGQALGTPAIKGTLASSGIASATAIGQPALAPRIANAGAIPTGVAFGQFVVGVEGGPITVVARGIASAAAIGRPRVQPVSAAPEATTGGTKRRRKQRPLQQWQPAFFAEPTPEPEPIAPPPPAPRPARILLAGAGISSAEAFGAPVIEFIGRGEQARRRAVAAIAELLLAA